MYMGWSSSSGQQSVCMWYWPRRGVAVGRERHAMYLGTLDYLLTHSYLPYIQWLRRKRQRQREKKRDR